jgi:hypothetical protein
LQRIRRHRMGDPRRGGGKFPGIFSWPFGPQAAPDIGRAHHHQLFSSVLHIV